MSNGNKNSCGRTNDIVAYMYDELGSAELRRFEDHLADCMSCIDEFAAVSDARFSIYEWHGEEFRHLPTPEFSIPYEAAPLPSIGFFAAVGEMIRGAGWPATVAAALLISIGLIFAPMMFTRTGEYQIALVEVESSSPTAAPLVAKLPDVEPIIETTSVDVMPRSVKTVSGRTVTKNEKRAGRRSAPSMTPVPAPMMGKAPVLSSYEDNEDRSLRLADLLDEVGG
jgi:hypothetical protein